MAPLPKMEPAIRRSAIFLAVWYSFVALVTWALALWHPPFVRDSAEWFVGMFTLGQWGGIWMVLLMLWWFVALFVAITLHEFGHAIVGVAVGFRFNSLRIWRVQFDRPFRISRYRGRGTGAGGWASLFPVKQDKLILRTVAMLLAGPGANLLSVAALLVLPYVKGRFSAVFIFWSLIMGLSNLVPFRSRAVISDGGRIFMLLQNRARGERWLAILKLVEELRTGVPYEKMTPGFLAKAVAIEDNSPDTVVAHALAYAAAFWQRNDDEAARALETCLRHANCAAPTARQSLMSDAAVFQARLRKRVDLAEQWLADIPEKTEYPWLRPRAEAAILEAKDNISGAQKKLDDIERMILATPNELLRELSLRGLRRWRAELQPQAEAAGVSPSHA
jgi:ribosomal protein S7